VEVIREDVPSGQFDPHGLLEFCDAILDPVSSVLESIPAKSALADASTDQVVRPDGIVIDDALPRSWHGSAASVEAPSARIPSDSWQSRSGGGNSGRWVSPTFPPPFSRRSVGVHDFPHLFPPVGGCPRLSLPPVGGCPRLSTHDFPHFSRRSVGVHDFPH
jgi:hypothetical protein